MESTRGSRAKSKRTTNNLTTRTFYFFRMHLSLFEAEKLFAVSNHWKALSGDVDDPCGFYCTIDVHGSMLAHPRLFDDRVFERLLTRAGGLLRELRLSQLPSLVMERNSSLDQIMQSQKHLVTLSVINCPVHAHYHVQWIRTKCPKLKRLSLKGCNLHTFDDGAERKTSMQEQTLQGLYKLVHSSLPNVLFDLELCELCKRIEDSYLEEYCKDCRRIHKCSECQQFFYLCGEEWDECYVGLECMGCHRLLCSNCTEQLGGKRYRTDRSKKPAKNTKKTKKKISKKLKKKNKKTKNTKNTSNKKSDRYWGCEGGRFTSCIEQMDGLITEIRDKAGAMSHICGHSTCPGCAVACPTCLRQLCVVSPGGRSRIRPCNALRQCVCCLEERCTHCAGERFEDGYSWAVNHGPCTLGEELEECRSFICQTCWDNGNKLKECCEWKICEPCLEPGGSVEQLTPRFFDAYTCDVCEEWSCGGQNCAKGYSLRCGACTTTFCKPCADATFEGKMDKVTDHLFNGCSWKVNTESFSSSKKPLYGIGRDAEEENPHDFCCGNCAVECERCGVFLCSFCEDHHDACGYCIIEDGEDEDDEDGVMLAHALLQLKK